MNILITENFPPKVGGSGRWFWEVYSRLNIATILVVAGNDENAAQFDATHDLHCYRWPLTMKNWGILSLSAASNYVKLFFMLRKILKCHDISAIHCGRGLPEGLLAWMACKWFRIPYLCYVHGEELPTYHSSRELNFLSLLVYSNARLIIVNSQNTKKLFRHYTGIENNVYVMHPGVNTNYFTPIVPNWENRQQLGWNGKKVILTVGRLQKRKGHDHVILAIKHIRKRISNILYAIVGAGEEQGYLESLVESEGVEDYVQFLGKIEDKTMLACYQQCDLFILANREIDGDFEGFGMVLAEAQACGKPVIAGKSGGTAEAMSPNETGLVIDADHPDMIANAVIELLVDPDRIAIMGKQATDWVRGNLDWNVLLKHAELIFAELSVKG